MKLGIAAIVLVVPGCLALLAGLSGMSRVRRLRRGGVATWALTVAPPTSEQAPGTPRQVLLQYTLADGQVFERIALAVKRRATLHPGQKVLVWYDPKDPGDVLVYGRWGRSADRAFVLAGAALVLLGAWLAFGS
jgi:hypothetical protein